MDQLDDRSYRLNAASISLGSTNGSSPGRAAVDEMIGRPSSRARARVTSHAGTRMPTFLRFICTSFGTSRVASRMKVYGPGKKRRSTR